jgi:hypothetical protein
VREKVDNKPKTRPDHISDIPCLGRRACRRPPALRHHRRQDPRAQAIQGVGRLCGGCEAASGRRSMRSKSVAGIPGLLDELLLSPPVAAKPARRIAHKARKPQSPLPNAGPTQERPTATICGARRGRPAGPSPATAQPREKITLQLPTALIAAYRDWSWEVRSQLSHLVERALADYRESRWKRP